MASQRGIAEHLEILLAVGDEVMDRAWKWRVDLRAANLPEWHISEKVGKRLSDKFPQLADALKEKDPGYDQFLNNAHGIIARLAPFFELLEHILEFRDATLPLIEEMSAQVVKFKIDLNELVFAGYYDLMLRFAKLHILLSIIAAPTGRGKLALAAYTKAYSLVHHGTYPDAYDTLARYLTEYEQPIPRLQEDLRKAKLRVADSLLPLGM